MVTVYSAVCVWWKEVFNGTNQLEEIMMAWDLGRWHRSEEKGPVTKTP